MPNLGGEVGKIGMVEMLAKRRPGSQVPGLPTGRAESGTTEARGASGKVMAKCALDV